MTALPDFDTGASDAELAIAATAGDQTAFAAIYDRYADRLHDFCIGMLRDRDSAADCVQEVFCTAATRLPQLREPDKLRPWLYSIARNEALRVIRGRRREELSEDIPDTASGDPGPDMLAARSELANLIAEAAGGLSERDRAVLELTYRHGLDGPELAEALGVTPANANVLTFRLRETVQRSLGALLLARNARRNPGGCPGLAVVLSGWDGAFTVLMRKRIARHIESCPDCERDRGRMVTPAALLAGAPVLIPAPHWLREQTLHRVELTSADFAMPATSAPTTGTANTEPTDALMPSVETPDVVTTASDNVRSDGAEIGSVDQLDDEAHVRRRHLLLLLGLLAAGLLTGVGALTMVWLQPHPAVSPAGLSGTASPTTAGTSSTAPPPMSPPPPAPSTTTTTTITATTSPSAAPSALPVVAVDTVTAPPPDLTTIASTDITTDPTITTQPTSASTSRPTITPPTASPTTTTRHRGSAPPAHVVRGAG